MPIYERMTIQGRGGALPQYQSNQTPYVPGQGVTARLSDARGQLEGAGQQAKYKALAGLGKAVDSAVDVGLKAYEDYSKTKATELVTKYKMGMRQSMYGEGGILTREGETAFTANSDTMKRSKEMRAELLKDMSGSRVEQIFNQLIDPEEAEYSLKAQEYEGKQYKTYHKRTYTAAAKDSAERAMTSFADPNEFAKNTGQSLYYQRQLLEQDGYSGEALERGLKEASSKIFRGAIENALAGNDVASAKRLLERGSRLSSGPLPHDLSKAEGLVETGNVDLDHRPMVKTEDGGTATVRSMSINFDGKEVLIPTVSEDGRLLSDDEAIQLYMRTGKHLGKFSTPEAATDYAQKLHENQEVQYLGQKKSYMTADDVAWGKNAIRTKQEALQAKAEAEAKKREEAAEKAFVESTSKEIMTQLDSFPKDWTMEQKEAKLVQLTADIEDPKRRKAVRSLVKADLDEKELVRKAGVVEELGLLDRTFAQNPNMTPTEKLSMIRTGTFSDETKEKAEKEIMDQIEGKENTYASAMGARVIRAKIDASSGTMDKKQIGAMALDYGLNSKDRNEVLEYQGKGQEYSQQRIDSLINSVLGEDTKEAQRIALYSALMRDTDILSGAKLDDKQLKSKIRSLALEGQQSGETGWFSGGMTLAESVNSGNGKIWRPDIPEGMEKTLSAELETRYPEYRSMTKEGKKLMQQAWYMNKYLGYPVEFTEEEKELLGGGK